MTLSEKSAYNSINTLTKEQLKSIGEMGFIFQVARDNDNWEMVLDLLNKITQLVD